MRLRTRKIISPELTGDGANFNRATYQFEREAEENASADATVTESGASMNNLDAQVISSGLGGYAFPASSRYDDDAWDSDKMLLAWVPWFNPAALGEEYIFLQSAVDGLLPGGIPLAATKT